jgi:hypothetical protein
MDFHGFQWILLDSYQWISMNTNEYQWIPMNINEYQWILMRLITSAYKMASYHGVDVVFVHTAQAIWCRWWWSDWSMSSTQQWIPGSKLIRIKKRALKVIHCLRSAINPASCRQTCKASPASCEIRSSRAQW